MTHRLRACLTRPSAIATLCVLAACQRASVWPELRDRVGNNHLVVREISGQIFISTDGGNLARGPAATPATREQRFIEFLNEFARPLRLTGTGPREFRAATPEFALDIDTTRLQTIHLEPVHRGASVVDRPQSAAFHAVTGELRAVLAQSVDFGTLPEPFAGNAADQERARVAVLRQLEGTAAQPSQLMVRPTPVISAQYRRAGYLVEYRRRDEAGAGLWVRALFDPRDDAVLILQKEERDDFPLRGGTR